MAGIAIKAPKAQFLAARQKPRFFFFRELKALAFGLTLQNRGLQRNQFLIHEARDKVLQHARFFSGGEWQGVMVHGG